MVTNRLAVADGPGATGYSFGGFGGEGGCPEFTGQVALTEAEMMEVNGGGKIKAAFQVGFAIGYNVVGPALFG